MRARSGAALGLAAFALAALLPAASAFEAAAHVDFEQHLDSEVPPDIRFHDESGRLVRLRDYLGASPAILVFTYFSCSNMCPAVIGNLAARLALAVPETHSAPEVLVVSVDPDDSPALAVLKKRELASRLGNAADRWHLLTGSASGIERLAGTVGFRYAYDPVSRQYAHPAGLVVLTPQGRISRYFFGFGYTPAQLAEGIASAREQHIASPIERLLLVCFHYDPVNGSRSSAILAALQILSLGSFAAALAWARRHLFGAAPGAAAPTGPRR